MRTRLVVAGSLVACLAATAVAYAEHVDPRRAHTFVVGARRAGSPTDRVDGARTGLSRTAFPTSRVVVVWRRTVGSSLQGPVIADESGNVYAIAGRGEVVVLSPDGAERSRTATGLPQPGPPSLLSDGTVVFTSALGEAAGVLRGAVRFRARVGRADAGITPVAPLPLDDGGAVVASAADLALLDAEGKIRARATLAEAITAPLVSGRAGGQPAVIVVGASGTVYAWTFGPDAVRVGSFGGPIDGGAALADAHTLVAVAGGGLHLTALDLDRGVTVTRATAPEGVYLGPPAMRGETAFVLGYGDTDSFAITLDASGREAARITLGPTAASLATDGGVGPLVIPPHSGPIVDAAGTVAFMTPDGDIGVAGATGSADTVGESVCPPPASLADPSARAVIASRGGIAPAQLSPGADGAFLVACPTGVVAKVAAARRR